MTSIFADGVRSIAMANGVVRIEFYQFRHQTDTQKLQPESAGVVNLPVTAVEDLAKQLGTTIEHLEKRKNKASKGDQATNDGQPEDGLDETLAQL